VTNFILGTTGYSVNTALLAKQYESIRFEDVHRDVLHLYPTQSCNVLDIGAGSGRDAAALAKNGHRVVAVEPTADLRSEGQLRHSHQAIKWVNDSLPELKQMRQLQRHFDLILLTAVWMHLNGAERKIAMATIVELLAKGGLISMTLRHGPVPHGRIMFDVSAEETIELGAQFGLYCRHRSTREDVQGRTDLLWSTVVLQQD
jgi:protein-L-isoaspartate O-methyltransferase